MTLESCALHLIEFGLIAAFFILWRRKCAEYDKLQWFLKRPLKDLRVWGQEVKDEDGGE